MPDLSWDISAYVEFQSKNLFYKENWAGIQPEHENILWEAALLIVSTV